MLKKVTIIFLLLIFSTNTFSQSILGDWKGEVQGTKGPIIFLFHIKKNKDGLISTIDVPTNRVSDLKPKFTSFKENKILIDGSNIGIKFKGILSKNGNEIIGEFTEGANTFPLNLKRGTLKVKTGISRPQEPQKPYPYKEENVSFYNKTDQLSLAGTLTLPNYKNTKHPVVVLITGSGPQDRNQTFSGHKTFLVLADYLTRKGIAVLRFDDRGFGESTGDFSTATTEDFATDVIAALQYLKTRNDVDIDNIGLIGHSEGGIIAPMVANRTKDVAFIVSLAGTGIIGSNLVYNQVISMRTFPVPNEEAFNKTMRKAIDIASSSKKLTEVQSELKQLYTNEVAPILKPMLGSDEKTEQVLNGLVSARTTPWMRYFYNYNPADEYAKIKIPVLSLNGAKDTQVPAKIHQEGIRKALEKANNKKFEIIELEGLNHLFQEANTGNMNEYSKIEQTFSPKALTIISDWILNQVN